MVQDAAFSQLAEELESRFAGNAETSWGEDDFNALALSAFRLQFERVAPFRAFCESRERTPSTVARWQDIPAVPTRAFKHVDFAVADPEVVFLTSGTTQGAGRRGRHLVPRTSLYRASLLPPFERHVLLGGSGSPGMPFLSLIPSPEAMPSSSLSFMVGTAARAFSTETHWLVDETGVLDEDRMRMVMRNVTDAGEPILLLGTALAFLHLVERLEQTPADRLPHGSRIMETGGFKGLDREVGRGELYARISAATGVANERIVSEYGMTELLSQLYEPVISEGPDAAGVHVPPPWLKVRALDPLTLDELEEGRPGLLAFFDLANAGSVCHVLTEDWGTVVSGRVRLEGRVPGAEPRGCSRAMDELMSAAEAMP